jgi:hypothetical protein
LMDRPRQEAIFILDHMRRTRDASSTLAFIKDGDLLTWGRNVHDAHPSDPTTTDHDSVRDITHRVNLMNGQDDRSVLGPGQRLISTIATLLSHILTLLHLLWQSSSTNTLVSTESTPIIPRCHRGTSSAQHMAAGVAWPSH